MSKISNLRENIRSQMTEIDNALIELNQGTFMVNGKECSYSSYIKSIEVLNKPPMPDSVFIDPTSCDNHPVKQFVKDVTEHAKDYPEIVAKAQEMYRQYYNAWNEYENTRDLKEYWLDTCEALAYSADNNIPSNQKILPLASKLRESSEYNVFNGLYDESIDGIFAKVMVKYSKAIESFQKTYIDSHLHVAYKDEFYEAINSGQHLSVKDLDRMGLGSLNYDAGAAKVFENYCQNCKELRNLDALRDQFGMQRAEIIENIEDMREPEILADIQEMQQSIDDMEIDNDAKSSEIVRSVYDEIEAASNENRNPKLDEYIKHPNTLTPEVIQQLSDNDVYYLLGKETNAETLEIRDNILQSNPEAIREALTAVYENLTMANIQTEIDAKMNDEYSKESSEEPDYDIQDGDNPSEETPYNDEPSVTEVPETGDVSSHSENDMGEMKYMFDIFNNMTPEQQQETIKSLPEEQLQTFIQALSKSLAPEQLSMFGITPPQPEVTKSKREQRREQKQMLAEKKTELQEHISKSKDNLQDLQAKLEEEKALVAEFQRHKEFLEQHGQHEDAEIFASIEKGINEHLQSQILLEKSIASESEKLNESKQELRDLTPTVFAKLQDRLAVINKEFDISKLNLFRNIANRIKSTQKLYETGIINKEGLKKETKSINTLFSRGANFLIYRNSLKTTKHLTPVIKKCHQELIRLEAKRKAIETYAMKRGVKIEDSMVMSNETHKLSAAEKKVQKTLEYIKSHAQKCLDKAKVHATQYCQARKELEMDKTNARKAIVDFINSSPLMTKETLNGYNLGLPQAVRISDVIAPNPLAATTVETKLANIVQSDQPHFVALCNVIKLSECGRINSVTAKAIMEELISPAMTQYFKDRTATPPANEINDKINKFNIASDIILKAYKENVIDKSYYELKGYEGYEEIADALSVYVRDNQDIKTQQIEQLTNTYKSEKSMKNTLLKSKKSVDLDR